MQRVGSVSGWPSGPTIQPAGIGSPRWASVLILPTAATVVAMSRTNGGCSPAGTAIAIGLVPSSRSEPPNGGT